MGKEKRVALALGLMLLAPLAVLRAGELDAALDAYRKGDLPGAFTLFKPLADKGNAEAERYVGKMYETGEVITRDDAQAARWLQRAAEQGDAEAEYLFGGMYFTGMGVAKDEDRGWEWFHKSAAQGYPQAKRLIDMVPKISGIPVNNAAIRALAATGYKALQERAEAGDAESQRRLALAYGLGRIGPRDPIKQAYWMRKAAENGDLPAQIGLGAAYMNGDGVPQDNTLARFWLEKAAARQDEFGGAKEALHQMEVEESWPTPAPPDFEEVRRKAEAGDLRAEVRLGQIYDTEHSVLKDDAKAAEWFGKAADRGDAEGEMGLSAFYAEGRVVAKNSVKAGLLLRQAADQGWPEAELELSAEYQLGIGGVPMDKAQAFDWLKKAAEAGNSKAENQLALSYMLGTLTPKDDVQATVWLRRAAEHGNGGAAQSLGDRFVHGLGVAKDPKEALFWYQKALANPDASSFTKGLAKTAITRIEKEQAN